MGSSPMSPYVRVEGRKAIGSKSCQFRNMNRSHVGLGWVCWTCEHWKFDEEVPAQWIFRRVTECNFAFHIMHISYTAYNPTEG